MKYPATTLLLFALAPALPAQETETPATEPEPAPVVLEDSAQETPQPAIEQPELPSALPAGEAVAEPTVEPEPAPEPVAEEPAQEPVAEEPAAEESTPEPALEPVAEEPAPEPTVEEPAPAPEPEITKPNEAETLICSGLSQMRDLLEKVIQVRNATLADAAAAEFQEGLTRLQAWDKELQTALEDPDTVKLYNSRYRSETEKLCLALSELCVQWVNVGYFQSDDLRAAVRRYAKEIPTAAGIRENTGWTCSGVILLSMLDDALSGVASAGSAEKAVANIQETVDALQAWRRATLPEGAETPVRRYLKRYRNFIEQKNLRILMQIKRLSYEEYFRVDGLALPLVEAADCVSRVCVLPEDEQLIRSGIVLLGVLEGTLAGVKDANSAKSACITIVRLSEELQQWGQSFAALPEPDPSALESYEKRYLPQIDQINERIKAQAARIASAEFYSCRELPATLVRLLMNFR